MTDTILVADIGGTNARFAIAEAKDDAVSIRDSQTFRAEDFETIRDAADAYLESVAEKPKRACFAAAGPIVDDEVNFTNSHWTLRALEITGPLNLDQFRIVNDFYSLAAGVAHLPEDALVEVKPGTPISDAPQLVIGPGTGLGQALIVPTRFGARVIATEGGHVSFAPRT
ncbi:MAG: glucokinase, partial [Marinicaulis sp.]|nr:glucokinase [Marinicaulis sp.]